MGAAAAAQSGASSAVPRNDAAAPPSAGDSADIGKTAALLETIAQAAAAAPAIDEARISALRDAVATGAFQPDPQKSAQKIIEWEGMLAGGTDSA
ncbi:MAG TPA: flagellar biosynthesis anti-sigma factor FlgM [Stellaceae bacterium]|nr:flagellar biosynthesis anti-sigma factor FlgM [Stellaceae bacterium]